MKIAVLGAGAMGGLFSAYLSKQNEVTVIDVYAALVEKLRVDGLVLQEPNGEETVYHMGATTDSTDMQPVDLVVVFVKAMFSRDALQNNRGIIGPNTYLMTLQNGSGHEDVLTEFAVDAAHVIIGSTQHNASVAGLGITKHGGSGKTIIGCPSGDSAHLDFIAKAFNACDLSCTVDGNVQKMIWNKMFTNVSLSALTGALQVPMGFVAENPHAWAACCQLLREAVDVAAGMGMTFNYDEKMAEVQTVCKNSPAGLTSIYADLRDGRRTEVDTISGSIVRASAKCDVPAPGHTMLVNLIHAMEDKAAQAK